MPESLSRRPTGVTLDDFNTDESSVSEFNNNSIEVSLTKYLDVVDQLDYLIEEHLESVDSKPEAKSGPSNAILDAAVRSEISSITKGRYKRS